MDHYPFIKMNYNDDATILKDFIKKKLDLWFSYESKHWIWSGEETLTTPCEDGDPNNTLNEKDMQPFCYSLME